jgi:hypothetical protein
MAAPIGWLRKLQTMTATMTPTTISAANWHGVDDRNDCVPSYRIAYTMKATSYMTVNSNAAQNNSTYQWFVCVESGDERRIARRTRSAWPRLCAATHF